MPASARHNYRTPRALADWNQDGFYTVQQSTRRGFVIIADTADIGSALLTDVEHLLDHAAEQQALVHLGMTSDRWTSPAWLLVTAYYWAFFSTVAFTRLIGQTVWFLDDTAVTNLSRLAPTGPDRPSPGAFNLSCGEVASANQREVRITKASGRIHDALWKRVFEVLGSRTKAVGDPEGNPMESRVFNCLSNASGRLGAAWPSSVRNAVNYRTGFAYKAVRGVRSIDLRSKIEHMAEWTVQSALEHLENETGKIAPSESIQVKPDPFCRALVFFAFIMQSLCVDLLEDLLDRHSLDRRWSQARVAFMDKALKAT